MRTSLRLTAAFACVAGVAACAPAAMASTRFTVEFDNWSGGGSAYVSDNGITSGHTLQTNLIRNGAVIASDSEPTYDAYGGYGYVTVPNKGALVAGDQVQILLDGNQEALQTFDGNPTINADACVGSTRFTGAVSDAGNFTLNVYKPTGNGSTWTNKAVSSSRSGGAYTATVTEALAATDEIDVEQDSVSNDTTITEYRSLKPGTCPAPTPPVTPTPTTTSTPTQPAKPTIAQIFAVLQAVVAQAGTEFNGLDLPSFEKTGSTSVPLTFLVPGKFQALLVFTSGGSARSARIARKAAKPKAITVASGSAARSTPGKASMKVRLSKAGKKLLRHRRSVRLTLQMVFTPADGTPAQKTTTKITLKKQPKAKAKKKKTKTKKAAKRG